VPPDPAWAERVALERPHALLEHEPAEADPTEGASTSDGRLMVPPHVAKESWKGPDGVTGGWIVWLPTINSKLP
jgi:hypothetical protein